MSDRQPAARVGYTEKQRADIRAVEEEGTLDLIADFIRRANSIGDRLESYAVHPRPDAKERPTGT